MHVNKTRLDTFLTIQHPHFSRTQVKKLIEEGFVLVNGEKRKPSFLLHGGEEIEMVRRAPEIPRAEPEAIPLKILFEDEELLVIDKQAGIVVHPAPGHYRGTLVSAVLHHLNNTPLPPLTVRGGGREGVLRPGIVHRLDKGTSGIMIIAKTDSAHQNLSNQFKGRKVHKTYMALVFGKFERDSGIISRPIGRDALHRRKFSSKTKHAREAVTRYEVIRKFGTGGGKEGLALVKLHPETGRTHQIRVHLSELRHPIVGDTLYGAKSFLSSVEDPVLREALEGVERPLLHALRLEWIHPKTAEKMGFEAPLPEDFQEILDRLHP